MISFTGSLLKGIRWSKDDTARFLGEFLTEPKSHVVFRPSAKRNARAGAELRLDPKTQLLYSGGRFFINGESFVTSNAPPPVCASWRTGAAHPRTGLPGRRSPV